MFLLSVSVLSPNFLSTLRDEAESLVTDLVNAANNSGPAAGRILLEFQNSSATIPSGKVKGVSQHLSLFSLEPVVSRHHHLVLRDAVQDRQEPGQEGCSAGRHASGGDK